MGGRGRRTPETTMLHPADPRPPTDDRDHEVNPWPLIVALAVIGPLAFGVAVAVLIAVIR
jgi:hypothetical protein